MKIDRSAYMLVAFQVRKEEQYIKTHSNGNEVFRHY